MKLVSPARSFVAPFPNQAKHRVASQLERVHRDLYGPVTPTTTSGNKYFLLLIDDFSRYMWVAMLPTKDATPAAIKRILAAAERECG